MAKKISNRTFDTLQVGAADLEAANILAGAEAAGILLGARVPIALTSRADTPRERRASAAIAAILAARNSQKSGEERCPEA